MHNVVICTIAVKICNSNDNKKKKIVTSDYIRYFRMAIKQHMR